MYNGFNSILIGYQRFGWFFYIPGKYTMCPVNLIRQVPSDYKNDLSILYNFINNYLEVAKKDAKDDKNSMDDFYIEIFYE